MSQNRLKKYSDSFDFGEQTFHVTPIVLSDSKAKYLKCCVNKRSSFESKPEWVYRGGWTSANGLQWVNENLRQFKQQHGPVCLFVWLGTCNLTQKNGKYISLRNQSSKVLCLFREDLKKIREICSSNNVKVVFFHIPYYSIKAWNQSKGHKSPENFSEEDKQLQNLVDQANCFIDELNCENSVSSPKFNLDLARSRKSKGKRARHYMNFNLYTDGIHPSKGLARAWLVSLLKNALQFCA